MTRLAPCRRRLGFTLIEMLVVLVIIGILLALLLPAINGAIKRARGAAVQAEISQLAQALASFKTKMGDYPPSRILINEGGWAKTSLTSPWATSGASADVSQGQLYLRGMIAFRKFWPRVLISTSATVGSATAWYDLNGNGVYDLASPGVPTDFYLQGNECLTFFLGGVPLPSFDTNSNVIGMQGMTGFAKDPTNPFHNSIIGNTMYSNNRNPPFFDFDAGRLRLSPTGSNMAGYVDSLNGSNPQAASFFAYFSTNNGSGYDPNDVNIGETDNLGTTPLNLNFLSNQSLTTGATVTASPSPNPYTSSFPSGSIANVTYQNAQSFQIISSGVDGIFGVGGYYNTSTQGNAALLPENTGSNNPLSNSSDPALRNVERDNLTNFHNGTLE